MNEEDEDSPTAERTSLPHPTGRDDGHLFSVKTMTLFEAMPKTKSCSVVVFELSAVSKEAKDVPIALWTLLPCPVGRDNGLWHGRRETTEDGE